MGRVNHGCCLPNDGFFFDFIKKITTLFKPLFETEDKGDSGDEQRDFDGIGAGFIKVFYTRWQWHVMLDSLSNGRVEVWDYILEQPITKTFGQVMYFKDKAKKERIEFELTKRGSK